MYLPSLYFNFTFKKCSLKRGLVRTRMISWKRLQLIVYSGARTQRFSKIQNLDLKKKVFGNSSNDENKLFYRLLYLFARNCKILTFFIFHYFKTLCFFSLLWILVTCDLFFAGPDGLKALDLGVRGALLGLLQVTVTLKNTQVYRCLKVFQSWFDKIPSMNAILSLPEGYWTLSLVKI